VIPCFNDGRTLPQAVASVCEQDACEVVVVDDGSTDSDTHRAIASLPAQRVRVIHQENRGPAAARMAGTRATTARYIFALDADDYLVPGALTILADHLDAHGDVGLVWGRYRFTGEKVHEKDTAAVLDPWLITYFNDLPAAAMIRREVLLTVGGWECLDREDFDLWMKFAERGVAGRGLSTIVYYHRIHGQRRAQAQIAHDAELWAILRARHPALFGARSTNRARSRAPAAAKVVIPLLDSLPVSQYRRTSLIVHVYSLVERRRRRHYVGTMMRRLRTRVRQAGPRNGTSLR
jgi:glycosyltransferase involved in cell wall biosynthesis